MSYFDRYTSVSDLEEKVFTSVVQKDNEIIFTTNKGDVYKMYHEQDCCENVYIESVNGDLEDLVDSPITLASERTESGSVGDWGDHFTYTFYTFATIKGYVDIRWNGGSNGYYSEGVSLIKIEPEINA